MYVCVGGWLGVGMRVHAQTKAPRCDFRRHKTTIAEVAVSRRDENVIVRSLYLLFNPNSSNATHPTTFQYTKYFTWCLLPKSLSVAMR